MAILVKAVFFAAVAVACAASIFFSWSASPEEALSEMLTWVNSGPRISQDQVSLFSSYSLYFASAIGMCVSTLAIVRLFDVIGIETEKSSMKWIDFAWYSVGALAAVAALNTVSLDTSRKQQEQIERSEIRFREIAQDQFLEARRACFDSRPRISFFLFTDDRNGLDLRDEIAIVGADQVCRAIESTESVTRLARSWRFQEDCRDAGFESSGTNEGEAFLSQDARRNAELTNYISAVAGACIWIHQLDEIQRRSRHQTAVSRAYENADISSNAKYYLIVLSLAALKLLKTFAEGFPRWMRREQVA